MRRVVLIAVALVLVATAGVWLVLRDDEPGGGSSARPDASEPTSEPTSDPPATAPTKTRPDCPSRARSFDPDAITVPGVVRRAAVITPPRDANGVPGIPSLDADGKNVFAYDTAQGVRPGDRIGNVLLNAHTFPDGSALGNRLLDGLDKGDRIVVQGNGRRLCYRVSEEVEVLATEGYPAYYDQEGRPQLAIIVCSGRRLGPGEWEKRTIWFASPQT